MPWDDEADEEWVEDEEDSDDDLLVCPSCDKAVHEDTQQCPYCGDWITPAYPGGRVRRWVWAAATVLLILSFVVWTVL